MKNILQHVSDLEIQAREINTIACPHCRKPTKVASGHTQDCEQCGGGINYVLLADRVDRLDALSELQQKTIDAVKNQRMTKVANLLDQCAACLYGSSNDIPSWELLQDTIKYLRGTS